MIQLDCTQIDFLSQVSIVLATASLLFGFFILFVMVVAFFRESPT